MAGMSRDDKTQVGCVLIGPDKEVLSTGFNGFPRGIRDDVPERYERPAKYMWFEHAERNAIYNAARRGAPLKGTTLIINAPPCTDCARGIIQAGVEEIIYPKDHAFVSRLDWQENITTATNMLVEAGVVVSVWDSANQIYLSKLI
jgi:dCMP deaminase